MSLSSNTTPQLASRGEQDINKQDDATKPRNSSSIYAFNILSPLNKDVISTTVLAESISTKHLYAIKVIQKQHLIANNELHLIHAAKPVFLLANKDRHPFLLNMHSCFQNPCQVFFVTEHVPGGDLLFHLQRLPFSAAQAHFYAAEIVLGLKYLHDNGILHRNLKLDNIALTADGHVKISDYYFCKAGMSHESRTSTFCGTAEFMAPEVLLDKEYGFPVDWWAFGVVLYQMITAQSPFTGEDEDEIYDAILGRDPAYPAELPVEMVSILQGLLMREPERRLGSGIEDAFEVMRHDYFQGLNWDDVYYKRVQVPFVPTVDGLRDMRNFDVSGTDVAAVLTPADAGFDQAMQNQFHDFDYSSDPI